MLMSATRLGSEECSSERIYRFEQKVPVPSYLAALVVGDLECR